MMDPSSVGDKEQGQDLKEESMFKVDELPSSTEADITDNTIMPTEVKPASLPEGNEKEEKTDNQVPLLTRKSKWKVVYALVRPERLKLCPECRDKGITSRVQRTQFQEWKYWVFCPRTTVCWFTRECKGKAVVNTKVLVKCGLPDQLEDHLDIYIEDIDKIVRLSISEYVRREFVQSPKSDAEALVADEELRKIVASFNGLEGLIQPPEPMSLSERDPTVAVDQRVSAADFSGLEGFEPTDSQECESKPDEEPNSNETLETKEPHDLPDEVKFLADILVADLPIQYKLKVKEAFSKMEGYNFPDDFISVITSGEVKLRKIFKMIDPEDDMKAELLEKLNETINNLKKILATHTDECE